MAAACATVPLTSVAHPHIFVDTGLVLHLDEQSRLTAVDVIWAYDDFYSLLIFEDRGLDNDADGVLRPDELGQLQGFDLAWTAGFAGDTYVTQGETELALGAPQHLVTEVDQGRILTRHRRQLAEPVAVQDLALRAYDPTYYTAYAMTQGVVIEGAEQGGCAAQVTPPDLDRAYTMVEELLYAMPSSQAEEAYPEVGAAFADTVQIICPETG